MSDCEKKIIVAEGNIGFIGGAMGGASFQAAQSTTLCQMIDSQIAAQTDKLNRLRNLREALSVNGLEVTAFELRSLLVF